MNKNTLIKIGATLIVVFIPCALYGGIGKNKEFIIISFVTLVLGIMFIALPLIWMEDKD